MTKQQITKFCQLSAEERARLIASRRTKGAFTLEFTDYRKLYDGIYMEMLPLSAKEQIEKFPEYCYR